MQVLINHNNITRSYLEDDDVTAVTEDVSIGGCMTGVGDGAVWDGGERSYNQDLKLLDHVSFAPIIRYCTEIDFC